MTVRIGCWPTEWRPEIVGGVSRLSVSTASVVLLMFVLSACSGASTRPAPAVAPTDGPLAVHTDPPAGGDQALLEGVLEYDGSCLTVVDQFNERYLPVFAHVRADWDGQVLTHDGGDTEPGQHIALAGGGGTSTAEADYVPDGCEFDAVFFVAANP